MSAHDPCGECTHAHIRYSRLLDGGGTVAERVDLLVGDRTQKGIDENLAALIDREACFPSLWRYCKARRPDAQVAGDLAPLVQGHTLRVHSFHRALIDDLDAQAVEPAPDRLGHALVPGESKLPLRHQADLDLRIDAGHLRRSLDASGSSATDHHLSASGCNGGQLFAQGLC